MRLLLDTHALLWWLAGDERLPLAARQAIDDSENIVSVSAVSAYEIMLKHRLGKLPDVASLVHSLASVIERQGFAATAVTFADAMHAGQLPLTLRDPFDRILIAQALLGDMTLISNERVFDDFGVRRLW